MTTPHPPGTQGIPPGQNPPGPVPPPSGPKRSGAPATVVAVLALVVAVVAVVVAWRAGDKADEALNRPVAVPAAATPTTGDPTPTTAATTGPVPTATGTDQDGGGLPTATPTIDQQTRFTVYYESKPLRLLPNCDHAIYVDLDAPAVQSASAVAEFSYRDPCGPDPGYLNLTEGVSGSEVGQPIKPADCKEKIDLSPLPDANQPVRKAQVYCVMTSGAKAQNAGLPLRMALITVSDVTTSGEVDLSVTAWNAPM